MTDNNHNPVGIQTDLAISLATLSRSVERIESALTGDPRIGQTGLVSRLATLEDQINKHERTMESWKSRFLGAVAAATGLGSAIQWFFTNHQK
tara:strand:+ start:956 stop:1234 length:279 start_codon:yes stop_codon:yes gene_type:complete